MCACMRGHVRQDACVCARTYTCLRQLFDVLEEEEFAFTRPVYNTIYPC